MDISFFKINQIFGAVSSLAERSLDAGKVTVREAFELSHIVSDVLDIPLENDFPPSREVKPENVDSGSGLVLSEIEIAALAAQSDKETEASESLPYVHETEEDERGP